MWSGISSVQRGYNTGPTYCPTGAVHLMLEGVYALGWLLTKVAFARRVIFACAFDFCKWLIKALLSVGVWHLLFSH